MSCVDTKYFPSQYVSVLYVFYFFLIWNGPLGRIQLFSKNTEESVEL